MTGAEVRTYAGSVEVAPLSPLRSRLVLPLPGVDAALDTLIGHELTHLLVSDIIWPGRSGDGGLPHWVKEGMAQPVVMRSH